MDETYMKSTHSHLFSFFVAIFSLWLDLAATSFGQTITFSTQPTSLYATIGTNATFTTHASGTIKGYQWFYNGLPLVNQTNFTLSLTNVQPTNIGNYFIIATNTTYTATSSVVRLVVGNIAAWGNNQYGECSVPITITNAIAVAAGYYHSLALKADGTVVAWGYNSYGQTNVPAGLTNVIAIACGDYASLALKSDGTISAWGSPNYTNIPPNITNAVSLATGYGFVIALLANGSLVVWPTNTYPYLIPPNGSFSAVATSSTGGFALQPSGSVKSWGSGTLTNVPNFITNIQAIACSYGDCFGLASSGNVVAWGDGYYSQTNIPASATNVAAISAGTFDCLALRQDGTIIAWGQNGGGTNVPAFVTNAAGIASGDGHSLAVIGPIPPAITTQPIDTQTTAIYPTAFLGEAIGSQPISYQWQVNGTNIAAATNPALSLSFVFSNMPYALALIASNAYGVTTSRVASVTVTPQLNVVAWGDNTFGQSSIPLILTNAIAVAAGYSHSLALRSDGSVIAWGSNKVGQTNVPLGLTNVISIAASSNFSLALKKDGTVAAWGAAAYTNVPASVTNAIAISAGPRFCAALLANNSVIVWPTNSASYSFPPTNGAFSQLALTASNGFALNPNGTVTAWGSGSLTNVPANATNIQSISCGQNSCFALTTNGNVIAWGDNTYSQTSVPGSATNVATLAASYNDCLALRQDGSIVGWGLNNAGDTLAPVFVTNASYLASGYAHSLAVIGPLPPNFQIQPISSQILNGGNVVFSGLALGSFPISYQWQINGTNLAFATNSSLSFIPSYSTTPYSITLIASNAYGMTTSRVATLSVTPQLSVAAWGNNGYSQCIVPQSLTNFVAVAGGQGFSTALKSDGTLVHWGDYAGQSIQPTNLTNVIAVSDGPACETVLRANGTIAFWSFSGGGGVSNFFSSNYGITKVVSGYDFFVVYYQSGYLAVGGLQNFEDSPDRGFTFPVFNAPGGIAGCLDLAAGNAHAVVLQTNGIPLVWGGNSYGQLNIPPGLSNVTAIAAAGNFSMALKSNGTVVVWGDNSRGQTNVPAGLSNVVQISATAYSCLALKNDGSLVAWGDDQWRETEIPAGLTNIISIKSGSDHLLALIGEGTPCITLQPFSTTIPAGGTALFQASASGKPPLSYQWLSNGLPILGATSNLYQITNVQSSAAATYSVVVTNSLGTATSQSVPLALGHVLVWGGNITEQNFLPASFADATYISCSENANTIIHGNGMVSAVGSDFGGELDFTNSISDFTSLVTSYLYTAGLRSNGTVAIQGNGFTAYSNQLIGVSNISFVCPSDNELTLLRSNGTAFAIPADTNFIGLTNIVAISQSPIWPFVTLALTDHGIVSAVGSMDNITPIPSGLTNIVAIALGEDSAFALRFDGTVIAWGTSFWGGQAPVGLSNVVAIAAGDLNGLAIKSDGSAVVWGVSTITNIPPHNGFIHQISAGFDSAAALLGDGSPYITIQPYNRTMLTGENTLLTTLAVGAQPLFYQWQYNGVAISGATNSSLSISNLPLTAAGAYTCVVGNTLGTATSASAQVTVNRSPIRFDTSTAGMHFTTNGFQLTLTGLSGHGPSLIYSSSDLISWQPIYTNAPVLGSYQYVDPSVTNSAALGSRFYRAVEQ